MAEGGVDDIMEPVPSNALEPRRMSSEPGITFDESDYRSKCNPSYKVPPTMYHYRRANTLRYQLFVGGCVCSVVYREDGIISNPMPLFV